MRNVTKIRVGKEVGKKYIDWALSIKLAGDKPSLAKEMLVMFMDELPVAHANIRKAYKEENYKDLLAHVHRLHGASCYCGVPFLKQILAETESGLKLGNKAEIPQLLNQIDEEIENVISAYNELDLDEL